MRLMQDQSRALRTLAQKAREVLAEDFEGRGRW